MKHILIYFLSYVKNNLDNLIWITIFAILIFGVFLVLSSKQYSNSVQQIFCRLLLSLNCSFIFVVTMFGRAVGETRDFKIMPFESYFSVFLEGNMELLLQIIMNIVMYIPLGVLLPCCFLLFEKYRYITFTTFVSSVCIEFIQAIFRIGLFEVDDIINNTLGGSIGVLIYILFIKLQNLLHKESEFHYEANYQETN